MGAAVGPTIGDGGNDAAEAGFDPAVGKTNAVGTTGPVPQANNISPNNVTAVTRQQLFINSSSSREACFSRSSLLNLAFHGSAPMAAHEISCYNHTKATSDIAEIESNGNGHRQDRKT